MSSLEQQRQVHDEWTAHIKSNDFDVLRWKHKVIRPLFMEIAKEMGIPYRDMHFTAEIWHLIDADRYNEVEKRFKAFLRDGVDISTEHEKERLDQR